jgi:hypothetical protein
MRESTCSVCAPSRELPQLQRRARFARLLALRTSQCRLSFFRDTSALRSSRLSPGVNVTTASADSPPARSHAPGLVSPSKNMAFRPVPSGSTWCVSRWLLDFAVPSPPIACTRSHCLFVFLRSCLCYALLSAWPRGFHLGFRYASCHSLRLPLFRTGTCPCQAQEDRRAAMCNVTHLSRSANPSRSCRQSM